MKFQQYFEERQSRKLSVLMTELRVWQGQTLLAEGTGHIRIENNDSFSFSAEVDLEPGVDELPQFQFMQLISVERDLVFVGRASDGEQVTARTGSITVSSTSLNSHLSIKGTLSHLNIKMETFSETRGTTFFGLLPNVPKDVYDRTSYISDNNQHFNRSGGEFDWLMFNAAKSNFVMRASTTGVAQVNIYTPYKCAWVDQLPKVFLTALGVRVGAQLDWLCLTKRSDDIDEVDLYPRAIKSKSSGLIQPMILKPRTNILLVADCVQFLFDYPESPLGPLQYSVWRADRQQDFAIRELSLGVAIEGISTFIVEKYSRDLHGPIAIQVNRDKALLKKTKGLLKTRMLEHRELQDLHREPYFKYLLNALSGAKPYSAGDKIKKAIELLCPNSAFSELHIKAWQNMRNSAAHAKVGGGIDQQRLDDYSLSAGLWEVLVRESILANPKHLSQVLKLLYSSKHHEISLSAFDLSVERREKGYSDERNWLDGEENFIRRQVADLKQSALVDCRRALALKEPHVSNVT